MVYKSIERDATVKNLLQKDKKENRYNGQPTFKTAPQVLTNEPILLFAKECSFLAGAPAEIDTFVITDNDFNTELNNV